MGEKRCIHGFCRDTEEKRSRHRMEDNIRINLEEWDGEGG
jgi:hypothetical protein